MAGINIKQLAEALNLSTSTISRAFRNNSGIKQVTKDLILAKAKELNYQPNHYASSLRDQKGNTIAVIVPELANNYFSQVIHGIEKVTKAKGYNILIYATDDDFEKEVDVIKHLHNGRAEGIIISVSGESKNHSYLNDFGARRLPMVQFDRVYDDVNTPKITTDDYHSSFVATEHLIEQGCKRIGYLVVKSDASIGKTRERGYLDALAKHNIDFDERLIIGCSNSYEENDPIIKEALKTLQLDGIFASVERLAFSTYYACHALKIKIPKQLKVISFSSLEIAPLLNPSLTTITQPATEIGSLAAQLLFDILSGKADATTVREQVVLTSKIIHRNSTKKS
ncbi:MAG TPA: LacI family DNA-binding transcriptional regulator [Pelobium sp.]